MPDKDARDGIQKVVSMGRRLLGGREPEPEYSGPERRSSQRIPFRIPVRAGVPGAEMRECRVCDINMRGLSIDSIEGVGVRQPVDITFSGFPGVVPPFTLRAEVVRLIERVPRAVGVRVDRANSTPEAMGHYRNLVLYYLRHRPLLQEVDSGYVEGRCASCGWVGRVGQRRPNCARCGGEVKPLRDAQ